MADNKDYTISIGLDCSYSNDKNSACITVKDSNGINAKVASDGDGDADVITPAINKLYKQVLGQAKKKLEEKKSPEKVSKKTDCADSRTSEQKLRSVLIDNHILKKRNEELQKQLNELAEKSDKHECKCADNNRKCNMAKRNTYDDVIDSMFDDYRNLSEALSRYIKFFD